jgi:hypothetical protein
LRIASISGNIAARNPETAVDPAGLERCDNQVGVIHAATTLNGLTGQRYLMKSLL